MCTRKGDRVQNFLLGLCFGGVSMLWEHTGGVDQIKVPSGLPMKGDKPQPFNTCHRLHTSLQTPQLTVVTKRLLVLHQNPLVLSAACK